MDERFKKYLEENNVQINSDITPDELVEALKVMLNMTFGELKMLFSDNNIPMKYAIIARYLMYKDGQLNIGGKIVERLKLNEGGTKIELKPIIDYTLV